MFMMRDRRPTRSNNASCQTALTKMRKMISKMIANNKMIVMGLRGRMMRRLRVILKVNMI
jgi:hypothetical protein